MAWRTERHWVFKLWRLTLLLLFLVGTVDLLFITTRSLISKVAVRDSWSNRSWREVLREPLARHAEPPLPDVSPVEPYRDLDLRAASPLTDLRLVLQVRPDGVVARYEIDLDRQHPLLAVVQSGQPAKNPALLLKYLCGEVQIDGRSLEYGPADVVIPENQSTARLIFTSRRFDPMSRSFEIVKQSPAIVLPLATGEMVVTFETEQARVWSETDLLAVKTSERTVLRLPVERRSFAAGVTMLEWTRQEGAAAERLAALINRVYDPPVIGHLLIGLLEALPFLLLLVWSKRYQFSRDQPEFERQRRIVGLYLVYHFLYFGFIALDDLGREWGGPAFWLLSLVRNDLPLPVRLAAKESFVLVAMMAAWFYLWPALTEERLWADEVPARRRWARLGLVILVSGLGTAMALLVTGDFLATETGGWSLGSFYALALGGLLLWLLLLCIWLAAELSMRRRALAALSLFFVLVYLVASQDQPWLFAHPKTKAALHLINYMLVALALTATFGKLIYAALSGKNVLGEWRGWSAPRKALVVLAVLGIALSTRSWVTPMVYWPIWSLSWQLKNLFYLALIPILAGFLRRVAMNRSALALPSSARIAGILLALCLFYSPTARWNYIPVCFLIGYLLLTRWLIPARRLDRSHFAHFSGADLSGIESKLPQVIRQIIRYNDAERIYKMLRKELLVRVGKGELSYEGYTEKLEAQQAAIAALRKDLTIEGHFAKEIVLGFGPTDSAWENGRRTALYSLLFALPWILLYLRNLVLAPAPPDSYLLLELFNSLASFIVTWGSYGFIFGYFYPSITGRNGMQKGLALWVTIILPNLAWTALVDTIDRGSWMSFGFWALQIFVQSMLIGLVAGDYEILRKAGYRFADLLEIHRLSSLSAWASSLFVAISAAIATLLTSGAVEVLSSVLKYAGVIPTEIKLPTK